jgi:hypothetical protein
MIPNWSEMSMSDPLNHLRSIWYHSKPSDIPYYHTHYTLSVAIELVHLLLTAARFAPAVHASRHTVRASWLVYQVNSVAKNVLLYSLYWAYYPNQFFAQILTARQL